MTLQQLIDKLETYNFECEAGPLFLCVDWMKLKSQVLLEKELAEHCEDEGCPHSGTPHSHPEYEKDLYECPKCGFLLPVLHPAPKEGFVLVPVEPTPKMVDATWNEHLAATESHNARNKRIYKAMLAAAQAEKGEAT